MIARWVLFVVLVAGCGPKNAPAPESAAGNEAASGSKPVQEEISGTEGGWNEADRPNVISSPDGGEATPVSPVCHQYMACCKDYAVALTGMEGIEASSVDAMLAGCESIQQFEGTEMGDQSCQAALEAMGQAMEALKGMEGFVAPASCKVAPGPPVTATAPVKQLSPACQQYKKCCKEFTVSLSKMEGVPESSVEAQMTACESIDLLEGPEAEPACVQALEAMRQAVDAYKTMPGFMPPTSCL